MLSYKCDSRSVATYRRFKRERCQLQLNDWGRFQIQATESNTVFDQLKVLIFEPRARPINQRVFSNVSEAM